MQDVASASEGYRAEVTAGVGVPLGAGMFDIGVGARLRDAKLNNFLFGVSAAEANGLRPAYDVGSTVQPFLAGSLAFPVNDRVSLVGFFEYEMLDDKVTKSPLVDDNEDAAIGVGLGVMFTLLRSRAAVDGRLTARDLQGHVHARSFAGTLILEGSAGE